MRHCSSVPLCFFDNQIFVGVAVTPPRGVTYVTAHPVNTVRLIHMPAYDDVLEA
jgi:hypothetical protein